MGDSSNTHKLSARRRRLVTWLDNRLSEGFSSLILALVIISSAIVVIASAIYLMFCSADGMEPAEALWTAFAFMTNPELPAFDDASASIAKSLVTLIVVMLGLLVTSALIGIVTTALTTFYEGLQRGFSPVDETGQITVIGFNENIQTLVSEFQLSGSIEGGQCFVLLDDKLSREEMERHFEAYTGLKLKRLRSKYGCRIVFRSCNLRDVGDLRRCAVERSKAILINAYEDALILKTLMAVSTLLRQESANDPDMVLPTVVCTFREEHFSRAAVHAGVNNTLRVLSLSATLSGIIAKTCYQPGLSNVLSELYSYSGSEFYLYDADRWAGMLFDELYPLFIEAIPAGIARPPAGHENDPYAELQIIINTPLCDSPDVYRETMTIRPGDKLVVLARGADRIRLREARWSPEEVRALRENPWPVDRTAGERSSESILVVGYDETFDRTILNLASYFHDVCPEGVKSNCSIKLLYRNKREARVKAARRRFLSIYTDERFAAHESQSHHGTDSADQPVRDILLGSTTISFQCAKSNAIDLPVLENVFLSGEHFDHVIVLSDLSMERENADTETLLTLLYLKAIAENAQAGVYGEDAIQPFRITSEIQNMENVDLAYNEFVSDFIISWKIIASLQAQIAENRDMYEVLRDLLNPRGTEVQLEPASLYIPREMLDGKTQIDFDEVLVRLRLMPLATEKRVLLGYAANGAAHVLCPPMGEDGRRTMVLGPDDVLIVLKSS